MAVSAMRQRVKNLLRPLVSPLLWRLRLPFDVMLPRIELLEQRVASMRDPALREAVDNLTRVWLRLQNEVARLSSSIPEAAAGAARARVAELEARLEVAERRLQVHTGDWNLRGGWTLRAGSSVAVHPRTVQPGIVVREKVDAALASGTLRLYLGCGPPPQSGYINVDVLDMPGVDAIGEAGALPFEPGCVDEIFSSHLVERFSQEEMRHRLLPHWYCILRPGGRLRTVTSDGEAMLAGVVQGRETFEDFREVLFGGQDGHGASHQNLFTPDSLCRIVEEAGFTAVEVPVRGRRSGRYLEFELVAEVPAATKPR